MRNSEQDVLRRERFSEEMIRVLKRVVTNHNHKQKHKHSPNVISKSVIVCHLSVATNHDLPFRRQLRSMTSFEVSLSRAASRAVRRAGAYVAEGKR